MDEDTLKALFKHLERITLLLGRIADGVEALADTNLQVVDSVNRME